MNIYNITKGQLIIVWIFGAIVSFFAFIIGVEDDNPAYLLLCIILVGVILFYTLGWYGKKK